MALIIGKNKIYENGVVKTITPPKSEQPKEAEKPAPEVRNEAPKAGKDAGKPAELAETPQESLGAARVGNRKTEGEKAPQDAPNEAKTAQSKSIIDGSQIKKPVRRTKKAVKK